MKDNIQANKIVYLQNSPEETIKHIPLIRKAHPQAFIIIIRHHNDEAVDYGSQINALITYPLLGKRLLTALTEGLSMPQPNAPVTPQVNESKKEEFVVHYDKKALLVEDNLVNQKVASIMLKKAGFDFDIANNGQEAVDYFNKGNDYLVVIMDCMMPVMDGFTATKEIRKIEQRDSLVETPIIALTASVIDDDIKRCFDSGMNDYLPKPFKKDMFIEKVELLLAKNKQIA